MILICFNLLGVLLQFLFNTWATFVDVCVYSFFWARATSMTRHCHPTTIKNPYWLHLATKQKHMKSYEGLGDKPLSGWIITSFNIQSLLSVLPHNLPGHDISRLSSLNFLTSVGKTLNVHWSFSELALLLTNFVPRRTMAATGQLHRAESSLFVAWVLFFMHEPHVRTNVIQAYSGIQKRPPVNMRKKRCLAAKASEWLVMAGGLHPLCY